MDNCGEVTIEGENYEIVDECTEEDDALNVQNKLLKEESRVKDEKYMETDNANQSVDDKPADKSASDSLNEPTKTEDINHEEKNITDTTDTNNFISTLKDIKDDQDAPCEIIYDSRINRSEEMILIKEDKFSENKSKYQIDFTADITLDQLEDSLGTIDKEVMLHLDELENMDPVTLQTQDDKESIIMEVCTDKAKHINEESNKDNIEKNTEKGEKMQQYEAKLATKIATVKAKMSKLARLLEFSYPSYKKWLQNMEKTHKSPICKLETSQNYPLKKSSINRWKFVCNRKSVQEVSKETDSADALLNKSAKTVWQLEPLAAWGVNYIAEFPPFVLHAAKVFEDFMQSTDQIEPPSVVENFSDDISLDMEQQEPVLEGKLQWLWLLICCNSMNELMVFVTAKNINRNTMDQLKHVFEHGPGKDCNVKSLYCKAVNKYNNTVVANTTFLTGSKSLVDTVGGVKIQLLPKTTFWYSLVEVENIANIVQELLAPCYKTTILEIGYGTGLIGLMMASKCQQVIGIGSRSQIEEAEMTCELNNITNASFMTGTPREIATKIPNIIKNSKTSAIIKANVGRAIEIMTCLRKIGSLSQLVMITTLTKHSVRAILELARPSDKNGHPFIPVKAHVVDTQPFGPNFEIIILMRKRFMSTSNQQQKRLIQTAGLQKGLRKEETKITSSNNDINIFEETQSKVAPLPKAVVKRANIGVIRTKINAPRKSGSNTFKRKGKGKCVTPPKMNDVSNKKKFDKILFKPWKAELPKKDRPNPELRINPLYEKKLREQKEQADLRGRLSSSHVDSEIINKVKEHQAILEIAKEKLSGSAPTVDATTAKQLQNMLNMVLEQTNKLQNQLPQSVWDRVAPPDNVKSLSDRRDFQNEQLIKNRYLQERNMQQSTAVTTMNRKLTSNNESIKKPSNIPPLEPNMIMPVNRNANNTDMAARTFQKSRNERYEDFNVHVYQQHQQSDQPWNRDEDFERSHWSDLGMRKRSESSMKRHLSPVRHHISPTRRYSPKRQMLSPPRKPLSPPKQHPSSFGRSTSPFGQRNETLGRSFTPTNSSLSGQRRAISPPMRPPVSPSRRPISPMRRPISPLMRSMSPRRHISPPRQQTSSMRMNLSSSRRQMSPINHQMSPPRRQISPPARVMSPRWELLGTRRPIMPERQQISPQMHVGSPPRLSSSRHMSPVRGHQSPPIRQRTPPRRYTDDWNTLSRSSIEQDKWQNDNNRLLGKPWHTERQSMNINWNCSSGNDNYRRVDNQDNWNIKETAQNTPWMNNGRYVRNNKQPNIKQNVKDIWATSSDNRWSGPVTSYTSNKEVWNMHGKESFGNKDEPWIDKNNTRWESVMTKDNWKPAGDKEDWNDLPEDAKDPWSDDNIMGLNENWQKFDKPSTSAWSRENDKTQTWINKKDTWQNKNQPISSKSIWQGSNNQKTGNSQWIDQNDKFKRFQPSGYQGGGDAMRRSWQPQSTFNYQQSRPSYTTNQFKDRC